MASEHAHPRARRGMRRSVVGLTAGTILALGLLSSCATSPDEPLARADLPQEMVVDYVRVYRAAE